MDLERRTCESAVTVECVLDDKRVDINPIAPFIEPEVHRVGQSFVGAACMGLGKDVCDRVVSLVIHGNAGLRAAGTPIENEVLLLRRMTLKFFRLSAKIRELSVAKS